MNRKEFTKIIPFILVLILLAVGAYFAYFKPIQPPGQSVVVPPAGPITVTGEITCLPKVGSGAQTLECAIGLRAEDGGHYGLQNLFELDPNYEFSVAGMRVEVSGTFIPESMSGPDGNKYDVVGTIDISSIVEISAPAPLPIGCTKEAKQCPDGSYVGRTGPNCEFAKCPATTPKAGSACIKDSDCGSAKYICEEIEGSGTACPSTDPSCVPTNTIITGECRVKDGYQCSTTADCTGGNLCYKNVCVSPIGRACSGPSDNGCPTDYECVQSCGPPVASENDPPPPYFCQLKGYVRSCPICLAKNTLIDTPAGKIPVQDLIEGTLVWTASRSGERTLGFVIKTSKTQVPADHQMVELILNDGRKVLVSPGHPTIDGRTLGDLMTGDLYDNSRVVSVNRATYKDGFTYDLSPSGETGFYFANGIMLGSTLR